MLRQNVNKMVFMYHPILPKRTPYSVINNIDFEKTTDEKNELDGTAGMTYK